MLDHDSDILHLLLCRDGQRVDVFNSAPDYWEEPPAEERAAQAGRPALWRDLLTAGATPEALRAAWDTPAVFAEDVLWRVAHLVGWNAERCGTGYTYLRRGEQDLTGFTRLAFRRAGESGLPAAGVGPPRFVQGGGQQRVALTVGTAFASVGATFQSLGGPGRGLRLAVWGSALAQGLVEVSTITLIRRGSDGKIAERRTITLAADTSDQGPVRRGTVEDFLLPAGRAQGHGLTFSLHAGPSLKRLMDAQMASWLGVVLAGQALAAGEADLHVGVVPLEHSDGQMSWSFRIAVSRAERH